MKTSWKTTVGGIGMILAGLGMIAKIVTAGNYTLDMFTPAIASISGGAGLIFARDNNVTSEQAGAKTTP